MVRRARQLLTDPRMIAGTAFTIFLVITFSVVSARPWNGTATLEEVENTQDCEYFKPEGNIFNYSIDDESVKKCVDKIWRKLKSEERRSKRKNRKQKRKEKSLLKKQKRRKRKGSKERKGKNERRRRRRPKSAEIGAEGGRRGRQRRRQRKLRRQRRLFLEQEEFRRWKRKISVASLLAEPVAQEAVGDLWSDLMAQGPQWQQIYRDMHRGQETGQTGEQSVSPAPPPGTA